MKKNDFSNQLKNDNYEPNSTTPALANLGTDYLSKLPLDILITIFMFLDLKSLKTAYKVSKFFNTLSTKTNHFSSEITYVTQYCHQVVEQQGWIASITFDKQLNVKEVITNKLVFVSEINEKYNHMSVIAISNDKKYIAVAHEKTNLYHRGIDLYDLVDKKFLYCFENDVLNATHTYISALDFLPDNSFIFAIGDAIFRYSLQNNTLTCIDTIYGVKSIQYSHDKNALIFSGYHIVIHDLNSYFNNQKISKNRVLSDV